VNDHDSRNNLQGVVRWQKRRECFLFAIMSISISMRLCVSSGEKWIMQRLVIAMLGSGLIATGYWLSERGPIGRIIETRMAKIDDKVFRRTPVTGRSASNLSPFDEILAWSGGRIHCRLLKHDVHIRAVTDEESYQGERLQQDN
jgi:hypothetical protein